MFPLVTSLARGERLLLDVYEPRQRQHKLCAAIWPRVQSESGSCFHRHQIWSVLRELYSVGHPCLPTHSFSVFKVYILCCDCDVHVTLFFLCRSLIIKCSSYRQAHWWSHEINRLAETCDFLKVQRFDGFAPPRENTLTKWSDTQSAWHPKLETSISDRFKNFRPLSHLINLYASWFLFEGMWMEVATLQTWLMLLNKPGRKSSSLIGGMCNLWKRGFYIMAF